MTSSVNKLLQSLSNQFINQNQRYNQNSNSRFGRSSSNDWTAEKIAKYLGVQVDSSPDVEANIVLQFLGGRRVIAVGNDTIRSVANIAKEELSQMQGSNQFEFSTFYKQNDIQVGFPTSMGLPFVYSYVTPTMVQLRGEFKLQRHGDAASGSHNNFNIPQHLNISIDLQASYASQSSSKFGIVAPHNHQEYFAGVKKNFEMSAGVKSSIAGNTQTKEVEFRFKPSNRNQRQVVFAYGTVPFTTKYNILAVKPVLEQSNTERIHIDRPERAQYKFGKSSTGVVFQYDASSENQDQDAHFFDFNVANYLNRVSNIPFPFVQRGLHANNVTLVYDPNQSSAEAARFSFTYKNKYASNSNGNSDSSRSDSSSSRNANYREAIPSSTDPDSRNRQQEFLNRVSSGIQEANAHVFDFSAEFENAGRSNNQFLATAAFANSDVSPASNALFYYGLNTGKSSGKSSADSYEVCASSKSFFQRVPEINMRDSFSEDPNSTLSVNLAFGDSCDKGVHFETKVLLTQSEQYRKKFEQSRMVKLCNQLIQKGEGLSFACQNATRMANMLDNFEFQVNVDGWDSKNNAGDSATATSPAQENSILPISIWLNRLGADYEYYNKPSQKQMPRNKFEIKTKFSQDLDYINITLLHTGEQSEFRRVYLNSDLPFRPYRLVHTLINSVRFPRDQKTNFPACDMNENTINTFDNKTFPAKLGNTWHTVFLYTPKQINSNKYHAMRDNEVVYGTKQQSVAVIAKEASNGKVIQMLLGDLTVELKPSSSSSVRSGRSSDGETSRAPAANVYINGQQVHVSESKSAEVFTSNGEILIKIFANTNGEVTAFSELYGLNLKYYGEIAKLYAAAQYKQNVRGLCGTYDGDKYTDFTTPKNCILANAEQFSASYALIDNDSSSSIKEKQREAANAPCYRETIGYSDFISDKEAGRHSQNQSNNRRYDNQDKYSSGNQINKNYAGSSQHSRNSHSTSCTDYKVKYVEQDNNTVCFSINLIPKCRSSCSESRTIQKEEPFYCMEKRDNAKYWIEEIRKGNRVNFRNKQPNKYMKVDEPELCN